MSQFTDYAENRLVDMVRGQGLTLPTDWHIALGSVADDDTFTEIGFTDYARVPVTRSLTNFLSTQGNDLASTGTSHATSNSEDVDFGIAGSAGSATPNFFGFFDASTAGNCWMWVPIPAPTAISNGDPVLFPAGTIDLTLGLSGGFTDYLANKLIDLIFRGQAFAWPANTYAAYTTTLPTNSTPGTEPAVGGYARSVIASSMTAWASTQGNTAASTGTSGRTYNLAGISFPVPSANQGAIVGAELWDSAGAGNMLVWGTSGATPITINAGPVAPSWPANAFGITFR